jgi:hypothetical protein
MTLAGLGSSVQYERGREGVGIDEPLVLGEMLDAHRHKG